MTSSREEFAEFVESMERPFWEPIGRYVFRFGMLERRVDSELCTLISLDHDVGVHLLNELDFAVRLQLLRVFARASNHQDEMKKLVADIGLQNEFRNTVVHGPWTAHFSDIDGKGPAWQKFGLSRQHRPKATNITVADLTKNAVEISKLEARLVKLVRAIRSGESAAFTSATDKI